MQGMQETHVPNFGIGEVTGVFEYVTEAILELGDRIGLNPSQTTQLLAAGLGSFETVLQVINETTCSGLVEPRPEARHFNNMIGDLLVGSESAIVGAENLEAVFAAMAGGSNVLVIQNHRSGADSVVMEVLTRRTFDRDIPSDWAYMSGHAVNLYAIPLMFALAVRRFQIFSVKNRSLGVAGATDVAMFQQNQRAMRALCSFCRPGGRLVVLYPEGGRGGTGLKSGELQTVCVPQIMRRSGPPLLIVPTYVHGAVSILPVCRGENEYNEVFENLRPGTATFTVGVPISWEDVQPSMPDPLGTIARGSQGGGGNCDDSRIYRGVMITTLMRLIANLAPDQQERGYYA